MVLLDEEFSHYGETIAPILPSFCLWLKYVQHAMILYVQFL